MDSINPLLNFSIDPRLIVFVWTDRINVSVSASKRFPIIVGPGVSYFIGWRATFK
jgi:hypothetical protein